MSQTLLSDSSITPPPSAAPTAESRSALQRSRMRRSRLIGALFLAGFLIYGSGASMAASLVGHPGFLAGIASAQSVLALGVFLILLNTAVDLAKAVLFFPVLEKHSKQTALVYFATMIVEVVFLNIGALALLMIIPLVQHAAEPGTTTLASLLVQLNGMAYQIGEMTLGVGATLLCLLLFRTRLVPRWLAVSGLIGYPCLVLGTIAEVFGVHIGLYLTMPGFFFELALPAWLLIKGFQKEAYQGPASILATA
ncbi:MAG: hypothetical protein QOE37_1546 [Microbacteriaceae bacterium]|nr:hypothetical protein [Microbacteriaceae bacterium]